MHNISKKTLLHTERLCTDTLNVLNKAWLPKPAPSTNEHADRQLREKQNGGVIAILV